jgi:hypothetical protein
MKRDVTRKEDALICSAALIEQSKRAFFCLAKPDVGPLHRRNYFRRKFNVKMGEKVPMNELVIPIAKQCSQTVIFGGKH